MFVGVVVREKVVGPPERNTMKYGALYEVVWLWRYRGTNIAPRHEKRLQREGEFFFNDPNRIRSSVRKSNKKFLPWGGVEIHPPGGGGGGGVILHKIEYFHCE